MDEQRENNVPRQDRMVTPERSVFGTQLPRPVGVGKHLIVVVILSVLALAIAIIFAQSQEVQSDGGKKDTKPASASAP